MKGKFIALYGINTVGKTYHAKRLVRRLRRLGKPAVYVKYPVYSLKPTGPCINRILRSGKKQSISEEELQLLFVLNRYQFQPKLLQLLNMGCAVVAEDYTGTGIAWGIAKGGDRSQLIKMNKFLVQEDVSILLVGKRKKSSREPGHIHEANERLQDCCERILRKLAKKRGWNIIQRQDDPRDTGDLIWRALKS